MFALPFPLFGVTVAWVLGRIERKVVAAPPASGWSLAGALGALVLGLGLAPRSVACALLLAPWSSARPRRSERSSS
ncbi:MAG: hypothetical protein FJ028_08910 [Chloroflexi bacterium]|nr:hypothetical protein [Chloroflexota bacterium]